MLVWLPHACRAWHGPLAPSLPTFPTCFSSPLQTLKGPSWPFILLAVSSLGHTFSRAPTTFAPVIVAPVMPLSNVHWPILMAIASQHCGVSLYSCMSSNLLFLLRISIAACQPEQRRQWGRACRQLAPPPALPINRTPASAVIALIVLMISAIVQAHSSHLAVPRSRLQATLAGQRSAQGPPPAQVRAIGHGDRSGQATRAPAAHRPAARRLPPSARCQQ